MKRVISFILVMFSVLCFSVTAFAATPNEEEFPYMAVSIEKLAFRDANGNFIKNLDKGIFVKVLYRDPRDSSRVWIDWNGLEGSIIERGIKGINQETDFNNSNIAFLTRALNLRVPETYEFITTLSAGTQVEVIGIDQYHSNRTVIKTGDLEGSVLSSSVKSAADLDFILIDIDNQMTYLYSHGVMISCSNVVTGTKDKRDTPRGFFSVKSMSETAVLKGEDYRVDVKYWMPFYGGCGLHSASWRSKFGGDIYTYNGSHGCVNCPTEFAKQLYENSFVGMPVIIP